MDNCLPETLSKVGVSREAILNKSKKMSSENTLGRFVYAKRYFLNLLAVSSTRNANYCILGPESSQESPESSQQSPESFLEQPSDLNEVIPNK